MLKSELELISWIKSRRDSRLNLCAFRRYIELSTYALASESANESSVKLKNQT